MTQTTEQHDTQAPFWTGQPDAATFEAMQQARLDRARALLDRVRVVSGPRTLDNTLVPFDDAGFVLELVASQSSLIENVHPDEALRATAERCSQQAAALATEVSLDHRCFEALAALDVSGADPATWRVCCATSAWPAWTATPRRARASPSCARSWWRWARRSRATSAPTCAT
jgi:Zn-dependent oligopeptidase